MRRFFGLSCLGVLAAASIAMQPPLACADATQALDQRLTPVFSAWDRKDAPGMSVAVMQHGKLIYSRGFGSAQLEYDAPITPATIFHVASVSKAFTTMAILLLEAEGRLSFDDEVQKHLPWVPRFDHPITIRQLASHTSGVRDQFELLTLAGWRMDDVITTNDVRTVMKQQRELNFPPQSATLYSNMGYALMADIVAAVSGQPFEQYTQERIFKPLGMTHTRFLANHEEVVKGRAYSYTRGSGGQWRSAVRNISNVGATGLLTTAEDLLLWLDNFRTLKVGGREVIARLLEVPVLSNGEPSMCFGAPYAGGMSLQHYRGARLVGQGGVSGGFRADIQWLPEHELAIAVLSNAADGDPQGHVRKVIDVLLANRLQPAPEDLLSSKPVRVDARKLESYAGLYHWYFGAVTFVRDADTLAANMAGTKLPLTALSDTEFRVDLGSTKAIVRFKPALDGTTETLELDIAGATSPGRRLITTTLRDSDIPQYLGSYYSPELRTNFEIGSDDRGLVIHHRRHGEVHLIPEQQPGSTGLPAAFAGDQWFGQRVTFEKGIDGGILGLRLTGITIRDLWFKKLALP